MTTRPLTVRSLSLLALTSLAAGALHARPHPAGAEGEHAAAAQAGNAWLATETAKLTASDGEILDWFASAVALFGNTAVVGAYGDDTGGDFSGSAYVFERAGGTLAS